MRPEKGKKQNPDKLSAKELKTTLNRKNETPPLSDSRTNYRNKTEPKVKKRRKKNKQRRKEKLLAYF